MTFFLVLFIPLGSIISRSIQESLILLLSLLVFDFTSYSVSFLSKSSCCMGEIGEDISMLKFSLYMIIYTGNGHKLHSHDTLFTFVFKKSDKLYRPQGHSTFFLRCLLFNIE